MKTEKQKGSIDVILFCVLAIVLVGMLGMMFWQFVINKPAEQTDTVQKNANGVTIPNEWKSYTSKQYGVSFVIPETWTVTEEAVTKQNSSGTNPRYDISVFRPGGTSIIEFTITVYDNDLETFVMAEKVYLQRIYAPPLNISVTEGKWHEYDARTIYVDPAKAKDPTAKYHIQLVQAGKFVYGVPFADDPHRSVLTGAVTKADWDKVISSIRITADTK